MTDSELAYKIYESLKQKYVTYQFEKLVDILQTHFVIVFQKSENNNTIKFHIEMATDPFKIYRREITLYSPDYQKPSRENGYQMPPLIKDYPEYEEMLKDARTIAKARGK